MAVPFSNSRLRIPHGFQGLLEGMAKQVLLMQPPDIYAFSATYFEDLLKKRDGKSPVFTYLMNDIAWEFVNLSFCLLPISSILTRSTAVCAFILFLEAINYGSRVIHSILI